MWPLSKKQKPKARKALAKRGVKQAQSLKRRRRMSLFIRWTLLLVIGTSAGTSGYIWQSGLLQKWMEQARGRVDQEIVDAGFVVGELKIEGQENTTVNQVKTALALKEGQSIVSLDLGNMVTRVEALPWVKSATLMRVLPDALAVTLTEHKAAALWQENGKLYLVDQAGKIITDQGLEKYGELPHVVGVGANEKLSGLLAMKAKYPDLFARVKSSVWIGKRRWDLNFYNGIKIKLPEKGADLAWDQFYHYQTQQKILAKEVLIVDLRLPGKTVLRLTPQEAERRRRLIKTGKKEQNV